MRTRHVCSKCGHNRILLIAVVPEIAGSSVRVPMTIATVVTGKTFMGDDKLGSAGELSAAVCRACGYTELYVSEPASITVDGKMVREVVGS
jgi:predicted nucleic-acid-binding Zn-ribbon protein